MAFRSAYKGSTYYILTDAVGNILNLEGKFTEKLTQTTRLFLSKVEAEQHIFALRQLCNRNLYLRWKRLSFEDVWKIA